MPKQTVGNVVVAYAENDTAPPLRVCLKDGDGNPIDLTGCTVVINIAYARYSHYYSPFRRIVDQGACVVDPDQVNFKGYVDWNPNDGDLSPAGSFHYNFEVTYPNTKVQTIPAHTYLPLIIRATAGGSRT